ncbi:MAG: ribonuclease III [Ignavibacteriales bacterium]|nr:ribonuclease III [Ignavibacteriales bacterium]
MLKKLFRLFSKKVLSSSDNYDLLRKEKIILKIKEITGQVPIKEEYFLKAFTHRSYLELAKENIKSNERLEFFGDSILGKITAEFLFHYFPDADEGFLTKTRAQIVNKNSLELIGFNLNLHDLIFINEKYLSKDKKKIGNIVADCLEALIGAVYLEFGEVTTKKFVDNFIIIPQIKNDDIKDDKNYKGKLLEFAHAMKLNQPTYTIVEQLGPQHNKIYKIRVDVEKDIFGIGTGPNKKTAEQEAAKHALDLINSLKPNDILN